LGGKNNQDEVAVLRCKSLPIESSWHVVSLKGKSYRLLQPHSRRIYWFRLTVGNNDFNYTNCRVKRHLISTSTQKHGLHAENILVETVLRIGSSKINPRYQTLFKSSNNQPVSFATTLGSGSLAQSPTFSDILFHLLLVMYQAID